MLHPRVWGVWVSHAGKPVLCRGWSHGEAKAKTLSCLLETYGIAISFSLSDTSYVDR